MRTLLAILLLCFAADANAHVVIEVKKPRMCVYEGRPVGCAFLFALMQKARGSHFCELHHCPRKI